MSRQHWLMKSEPFKYPFAQLVRDGVTTWDGVRNFEARNNLRAMKAGDLVLFYHSSEGKAVVGVARVKREAYPDASAPGEDWSVVDIEPVAPLKTAVTLDAVRSDTALADIALVKKPRISVVPVSKEHFDRILGMGKTTRATPANAAAAKPKASEETTATKAAPKKVAKVAAAPKATKAAAAKAPAKKVAAKKAAAKKAAAKKAAAKKAAPKKAKAAKKAAPAKRR